MCAEHERIMNNGCRNCTGVAAEGVRDICSYTCRCKALHLGCYPDVESELIRV